MLVGYSASKRSKCLPYEDKSDVRVDKASK